MFNPLKQYTLCLSCRLRQDIAAKQLSRCRKTSLVKSTAIRAIYQSTTRKTNQDRSETRAPQQESDFSSTTSDQSLAQSHDAKALHDAVVNARRRYGDRLPDGLLSVEQGKIYERLYGKPLKLVEELGGDDHHLLGEEPEAGTKVLQSQNGEWEEVEYDDEGNLQREEDDGDDVQLARDIDTAMFGEDIEFEDEYDEHDERTGGEQRTHHLTLANRFGTSPSTIQLSPETLVDPIRDLISDRSTSLVDNAHRIFGGIGLPHSTSTPLLGKTMQQKAIPIDPSQSRMTDSEADVYLSVIMPAVYSSVIGVLTETRKRLGTAWAESMVRRAEAGELRILDAGGAGMGVLAVREILRAEWQRMHEEGDADTMPLGIAEADGRIGGAGLSPPLGHATVLTGSDTLRHRSSQLLENTTFVPRLPDYVHTETAKQSGKFDIVIAPHTIWPLREQWQRKAHIENLWSLLRVDGGVLCILEKGVPRGFEAVAAARHYFLKSRIASPEVQDDPLENNGDADAEWEAPPSRKKEVGMIVAPCTNHTACPMYSGISMGTIKGRKDICHFKQRYIRPPFLQRILRARDKNFEDIKFSYLAVMRGKDLRSKTQSTTELASQPAAFQGEEATLRALKGYEAVDPASNSEQPQPSSLSLPRAILPPLKRRGHIILDLCTPSGNIERWTVPRSFSKQAFRDAKKSSWGDLWALGAKTRVMRRVRVGKHERREEKRELSKKEKKAKRKMSERRAGKAHNLVKNM